MDLLKIYGKYAMELKCVQLTLDKTDIHIFFLSLHKNICYGYSLEVPNF